MSEQYIDISSAFLGSHSQSWKETTNKLLFKTLQANHNAYVGLKAIFHCCEGAYAGYINLTQFANFIKNFNRAATLQGSL